MSEITVSDSIQRHVARTLNEEFFDEHNNPADIVRTRVTDNIIVFCDQYQASQSFLIEITFPIKRGKASQTFTEINHSLELIQNIIKYTEMICYRDRNKLFLRKLFF